MAQPMTLVATPDPDDNQPDLTCPAFCDGTCPEANDKPGNLHHTSGFSTITLDTPNGTSTVDWDISTTRTDADGKPGKHVVNLLSLHSRGEAVMDAADARRMAALLLNAADAADPLPTGTFVVPAEGVRIRDEILTDLGWQTVIGQMAFADNDQVAIWTEDLAHDPDTDGWPFKAGEPVAVRRPTGEAVDVLWSLTSTEVQP